LAFLKLLLLLQVLSLRRRRQPVLIVGGPGGSGRGHNVVHRHLSAKEMRTKEKVSKSLDFY
jgi:hypothetical protein